MDCPNCGLVNPETAQRCDCGYDFEAKTVKESYLNLSSTSPGCVTKEGGILIVPRGAVLPPYCVKCGIPTQADRVKKTFGWHPPWIIVFLFLGLLPVIIALAITEKKLELAVPLCPDHRKRRKKLQNIGLALLALCIPVGISIGRAVGGSDDVGWSILFSTLVCIAALVVLLPMRSLLRPARIDEFGGRFEKASDAFMTRIPNTDQLVGSGVTNTSAESKSASPSIVVKEKVSIGTSSPIVVASISCYQCCTPNPNDAVYCSKCGRELHRTEASIQAASKPVPPVGGLAWVTQPISGVSFGGGDAALRATPNVADSNVRPSVETPSDVATVASVPSPVYANMGQRFVAYFADLVLVYLIVFSVYVLAGALRMSFSNDEGIGFYVIFYLSLFIYMVAAQTAYHTTVGKYIQGLEVRSERQKRMYPSFWQVLLRETIGRVLASILWGAGYWTAINKPKKQAWSDAIAGTVVTVRQRNRALRRALTAFVVVAFIVDVSAIGYGLYKEDQGKRIAAYKKEVESTTTDVENARQAVDSKLSETSSGNSSDSFILFQNRMMSLKPDLDRYEAQLDRIQSLLRRVDSERVMETENERVYYVTLRKVYEVRKRQAEKLRQEADLVINSDGAAASVASLRKDLQFLDSDIEGLNQEASRLLEQIGVK